MKLRDYRYVHFSQLLVQCFKCYLYINELMQSELETLQREKGGIMGEKNVIEELKQKAVKNVTELQVL